MTATALSPRERRIGRRMAARDQGALFRALLAFRGRPAGKRFCLGRLFAVGGEGALFEVAVVAGPAPPVRLLGKIALARWERPVDLTSKVLRKRRSVIEEEEALLRTAGSPFLPAAFGLHRVVNPNLEAARGGAFAEPEPCLVMERLPGQDLDTWLCRVHRGALDRALLRRTLDRLCVGVVQALVDLERRGYLYADLRPGNLRVVGRPERRVRLLDAGGCVPVDGDGSRFPHVPSYLPPQGFKELSEGVLKPCPAVQAAMAGRTLFEVATGSTPKASRHLDMVRVLRAPVSPAVSDVIAGLANGDFPDCAAALAALAKRARKRLPAR